MARKRPAPARKATPGRAEEPRAPAAFRSPRQVLAEVWGWFQPASLAELHAALLRGDGDEDPRSPRGPFDFRPAAVLAVAAVLLTLMEYTGYSSNFRAWFPAAHSDPRWGELFGMLWWAGVRFGGFVALPFLAVTLLFDRPLTSFGLRLRGAGRHLAVYGAMLLVVAPLVLFFSRTDRFRATYPFYRLADRSLLDFLAWEAAYILQFFGVEFFFRGFLLHGTKRQLGAYAIAVSIVPYCMIHFGKPLPETLGSIIAGTVLGVLSLRTRSIWAGFLVHVSVAVGMDVLSIAQGLPAAASKYSALAGLP